MEENKKRRINLVDTSEMVWQQRREREEKSVHSNTVQKDNVLYRTAKEAKIAEERLYAEKSQQGQKSKESLIEKQRRAELLRQGQGLDVRNQILRQEKNLGIDGILSKNELRKAQYSPEYIGRKKPMNIKKKDVEGLEGSIKREKKAKHRLLPSERRQRLTRTKIERHRKKTLEKTARKELFIKDSKGNKISVDRLRKLRGLDRNKPVTKRHNDFSKTHEASRRKEQQKMQNQMRIRKREEYSR